MKWQKKGLILCPDGQLEWWHSHAMAPVAILLNSERIRVFIGGWDYAGISRIGYVDVAAENPGKVLNVSTKPVVDLGYPGTFDDNGVFPASVMWVGDRIYLYYTGFEIGHKVRYFMFGGLAISDDKGETFYKAQKTPVTDRADEGLYFRGGPCALHEDGIFKMWYSSGSEWANVGGKMRPTYDIRYLESPDGIQCPPRGQLSLSYDRKYEHGLGRPQIIKVGNTYRLFYTRRTKDMRYSSGFAESTDGVNWVRKDEEIGISHSESGWDSEMVYFPNVLPVENRVYLFYNGNDFGRTGFGYAELAAW